MKLILIVLSSVFGYIVVALSLSALVSSIQRSRAAKMVKDTTVPLVNSMGFVSCFCGQQGAGKSTMASGVANILNDLLKNTAFATIRKIQIIYPSVDFSLIDSCIKECFEHGFCNTDYVILVLFKTVPEIESTFKGGYTDDGINFISNLDNFRDYVDAFLALFRNNYTYFLKRSFYSRITKTNAMPLAYDSIAIKDRYVRKDYNLYRYTVLFQDEILLFGGSNNFWQSEAAEDSGVSDYFRLIRHIGKKTMFYVGTAQDFNRIIKDRRELFNNIFEIFGHEEINTTKVRYFFLYLAESLINYAYRFYQDSFALRTRSELVGKSDTFFRKLLNRVEHCRKKLQARWFLRYYGIRYTDPDDYLKSIEKCSHPAELFGLCFPLPYCYGCLNTYEYACVHDFLSFRSKDNPNYTEFKGRPGLAVRDELARDILAKKTPRAAKKFLAESPEAQPSGPYVP